MQVKRESMVLGLQLLSVGVDGLILDSAAGEEILFVQHAIAVALGRHPPELPGTLYITTKRVVWLSDADKSKGYAVDLLSICMREVSVFCDHDLYLPSCICIQIKTEDDENANSIDSNSEGAEILELSKIRMMWLWPSDLGRLDYLFDGFRRCLKHEANEVKPGYIFGDHHLSERMLKVEELIKGLSGMPVSTADIVQVDKSSLMSDNSLQHMKNQATLSDIHRIAREISMLKLSVNDAKVLRAKNDLFIGNLERQIQSALSLFKVCLEDCFVYSIKDQNASFIDKCLHAYGYIDSILAAEEIFRKTIVAPLVQNILCGDTSLEELEEYYRQIKRCIENDLSFFLKLSLSDDLGLHVSDFWANSILKEVILAIKKEKPKAFSPDELMVFLNNYNSSLRFLAFLEGYFPSLADVDMLRSDMMRQLNVRDYFSHRLQEIARSLDSVLGDYANTLSDKKVRTKFRSRHSKFMLARMIVRKRNYNSINSEADGINDFIFVIHEMQSLWHDAHFLLTNFRGDYHGGDVQVRDHAILSILQAKNLLEKCLPAVIDTLIETIVKKSVEGLRQLYWIIETFKYGRFMWDIKLPEEASPYVFLVLQPLLTFVDGANTKHLNSETIHQILIGSLKRITSCYYVVVAQIVSVVKQVKVREVEKNPDALEKITSSVNWICTQLFLDIQEYKSAIDLVLKISNAEVPESHSLVHSLLDLM